MAGAGRPIDLPCRDGGHGSGAGNALHPGESRSPGMGCNGRVHRAGGADDPADRRNRVRLPAGRAVGARGRRSDHSAPAAVRSRPPGAGGMTGSYRGSGHAGAVVDRNPGAADRIPPDNRPEGLRLRMTAVVWLAAWELARALPEAVVFAVADAAALALHRCAGRTRRRVTRNFRRVVPSDRLAGTVRAAFRSYARYWVEAFRAADISAADIDARVTTEGFERLDGVLERGNGAIVLLSHHGSWDIAARWAETKGYHLAVVAEVVRPRALFRKFVALREAIGLEVVPMQRRATMTGRLIEVAEANHMIGLLTDRDLTGAAPVVRFFGEPTRIPIGATVLSRRSGAAIVPVAMLQRPGRRWHMKVLPPFTVDGSDIREGNQRVARALEDLILTAPEQWHAFQPVWLEDLPEHRRGDWQPGADSAA
ncbi:MAG: phosphatidylinositol mannoside acyltransferase [Nitriliruptorales bacterium]|nr:phosphatidylinositol mannoside acyltransferase [Nitriliruptorales bacterium]